MVGVIAVGDVTQESNGIYRFKIFNGLHWIDNSENATLVCCKRGNQLNPWFMSQITENKLLTREDVQAFMKHFRDTYKNQLS